MPFNRIVATLPSEVDLRIRKAWEEMKTAVNSIAEAGGSAGPQGPAGPTGPQGPAGGGSTTLATLLDVQLTALADGDLLTYSGSLSKWINGTVISLGGPF